MCCLPDMGAALHGCCLIDVGAALHGCCLTDHGCALVFLLLSSPAAAAALAPPQVFTSIGQLELFYDQAPDVMRSCSMALQLLSVCIGSYLSGEGKENSVVGGAGWGGSRHLRLRPAALPPVCVGSCPLRPAGRLVLGGRAPKHMPAAAARP